MRFPLILTLLGTLARVYAQSDLALTLDGTVVPNAGGDQQPTGSGYTYISYTSTIIVTTDSEAAVSTGASNATSIDSGSEPSVTALVGGTRTQDGNATQTTEIAEQPTNTQPCNNYPEFCTRQYSNITEVCAHNSPFAVRNNAASNQALDVTQQLDDGIRMLQGQAHFENDTLYFCHTTCDLLNAGTVENYLTEVTAWLRQNPYEVVTILFGNSDRASPSNFATPIQNSGLGRYVYEPVKIPMALDDWPTLESMILSQKRVVVFMDYGADQNEVSYILDQFSQLWETPFSPTDINFPCTAQRPPDLPDDQARDRLYMANHNLNIDVEIAGTSFLIPNTATLAETNGLNGTGSLGQMTEQCTDDWGRPPNFLLVDYYNIGSFNGSVFEVAARANNVTYNRECCGEPRSSATLASPSMGLVMASIVMLFVFSS